MSTPVQREALESSGALSIKDLYEQGSKCCQQYSALTMQVRTMAQHVLVGYAVGMGITLSRAVELPLRYFQAIVAGAGTILVVFATVLWLLNYHHSTAFRAIRDEVLIKLEAEVPGKPTGPWSAHRAERGTRKLGPFLASGLAWHFPFIALASVGAVSIIIPFILFS